jgi:hypothetical protein
MASDLQRYGGMVACGVPELRQLLLTCSFLNLLVIFMPPARTRRLRCCGSRTRNQC